MLREEEVCALVSCITLYECIVIVVNFSPVNELMCVPVRQGPPAGYKTHFTEAGLMHCDK